MLTKRKKQTIGVAAVAALILSGGVYAWSNTNQHKTNEFEADISLNDVTLIEDFSAVKQWKVSDDPIKKEIRVINNTMQETGSDAYVRIQLKEFLEFSVKTEVLSDYRYAVTTAGQFAKFPTDSLKENDTVAYALAKAYADANNLNESDIEFIEKSAYEGDNNFFIRTKEEATNGQYGKFLVTKLDKGTTAESIIQNGIANGQEDAKVANKHHDKGDNKEDLYTTQTFGLTPTPATIDAARYYPNLRHDVPTGGGIITGKDLKDYIKWSFGTDVKLITEFNPATDTTPMWVIDTATGWVYWSQPLAPGVTTSNFLETVDLLQMPGKVSLYYAIHTNLEAVDKAGLTGMAEVPDKIQTAWEMTTP